MRKSFGLVLLLLSSALPCEAKHRSSHAFDNLERAARDAVTSAPKDDETCFAPDEPCSAKLVKFIQSAKESIDIAIFEFTDENLGKAIAQAAERIPVRLVVNPKLMHDPKEAFAIVINSRAKIKKGKQKGIMHNKFTLVDGKRMETGSYNYTRRAGNDNQENQLYLSNPGIVNRYKERFEKMWREGKN